MRWVYLVLLIVVVAVIVIFIVQNHENVPVTFLHQKITAPLSLFFVVIYLLGMWTGGTVIAFVKRAYHRATEHEQQKAASQAR
jgi:uncharacterized integral membrane protein